MSQTIGGKPVIEKDMPELRSCDIVLGAKKQSAIGSRDIWQWPEFHAFIARAGLADIPMRGITIDLPFNGLAVFTCEILAGGSISVNLEKADHEST